MRLVAHNKFGEIIDIPITSVVVYDDSDNPISIAIKLMDGTAIVSHVADKDFSETLRTLGIDKTVVVDKLDASSLTKLF